MIDPADVHKAMQDAPHDGKPYRQARAAIAFLAEPRAAPDSIVVDGTTVFNLRPDTAEEPACVLWGMVPMFGMMMHVAFVEVSDEEDDLQEPVGHDYDLYASMQSISEGRFETVTIPGYPGKYVAIVYPMGD